jgi:hypothetical protein
VVLPEQHRSTDPDRRLDPNFPMINVFAAVHTDADSDDSLAVLIPSGVVGSSCRHVLRIPQRAAVDESIVGVLRGTLLDGANRTEMMQVFYKAQVT